MSSYPLRARDKVIPATPAKRTRGRPRKIPLFGNSINNPSTTPNRIKRLFSQTDANGENPPGETDDLEARTMKKSTLTPRSPPPQRSQELGSPPPSSCSDQAPLMQSNAPALASSSVSTAAMAQSKPAANAQPPQSGMDSLLALIEKMRQENSLNFSALKQDVSDSNNSLRKEMQFLKDRLDKKEKERDEQHAAVSARVQAVEEKVALNESETERRLADLERRCAIAEDSAAKQASQLKPTELTSKLNELERKCEQQDRLARKNNIIIKSLKSESGNIVGVVNQFLFDRFELADAALEAKWVGKNQSLIVAKIRDSDTKRHIMRTKRSVLEGTDIYVDNDLTKVDRDVQSKLREIRRAELDNNRKVKLGQLSIQIDDVWFYWDDASGGLTELVQPRLEPGRKQRSKKRNAAHLASPPENPKNPKNPKNAEPAKNPITEDISPSHSGMPTV